ncbi:hypothetical protein CEXT_106451 [Caerostris extrusa]|uniref:Uncharacterized protein n=1 Tax=Caerostris extrusa TaxID=172846 RepID=A0AAV4VXB6_CAEEX|nr:hypothetical protein CEXT_106451 [Caerostris extrusa]
MKRKSSRRFFSWERESPAFFTWGVRGRRMRGCRGAPASIIIIIHATPDSVGTEREGFPEEDSGGVPWLALQPAPDFFIFNSFAAAGCYPESDSSSSAMASAPVTPSGSQ